jgi:serine/threonine protein kinase
MDNHNLPIDFQLISKYRIKKVLGQGGFGITYLAEDTFLDKEVCIKELFVTGSSTRGANMTVLTQNMKEFSFADFKERFIQEGKQLAKFNHPNIVKVLDFIEANNTAYVVMEYISGQTLKEKVAYGGPLSTDASQKIIESILDAVEVVHKAGMLHRDIKPDNLIIGDDGRVVLIDFGSARAYSDEKTIAQTAMVSPGYAPLEQYNPKARKGTFTDIYSIGATFYFMLTGEKPLNVTERYTEKLIAPHELNPSVSIQVSSAVMLAMEMKPEDRFQNVSDFRLALQQLTNAQNKKEEKKSVIIPKTENSTTLQPKEKINKNNKVIIFSVIGGFALILLLLFNVFGGNSQNIETSDATTSEPSYSDGAYGQNDSAKAESKAENKIKGEALIDTTNAEENNKLVFALDKIAKSLDRAYFKTVRASTGYIHDYGFDIGWILNKFEYVNSIMSYKEFQTKTEIPIYIKGPHSSSKLNLNSRFSFGHYNPIFVKYLQKSISDLLSDRNFILETKSILNKYDIINFLKKIQSIYYITQSNSSEFRSIKAEYLNRINNNTLSEFAYGELVPEKLNSVEYWNWSESTYNFWIRRDIDNTIHIWAQIISEVITAYEGAYESKKK